VTQAWVEQGYHRTEHAEIGTGPLHRYLDSPTVDRDCPNSETLRRAFRSIDIRRQRRSDGTLSLAVVRFEIPARYRHLETLRVSYARWDLSTVDWVDPQALTAVCSFMPLDKTANADGQRRRLHPLEPHQSNRLPQATTELPPLLRKLLADYAATGLPPSYLPKHDDQETS